MKKIQDILFASKSPVALGLFRIGFGLIMVYQFYHIKDYFLNTLVYSNYFIKYDYFEWVSLTSVENLEVIFIVAQIASFFIAIGLFYRVSSSIVFFIWCYLFFTDQGHNNNHYYLIAMLLFILVFVNANQWGSVKNVKQKSSLIPEWNYLVIKLLIFIVYFYGGLAKLNWDWLNGYPLKFWLTGREDLGSFIQGVLEKDITIYIVSYYGLFFDLVVGFFLFHKKLKYLALALMIPFHISNHFLWPIGVFPWLSIFMTVLFFEKEVSQLIKISRDRVFIVSSQIKKTITILFICFFTFQFLFPFRQHLYVGKTNWHGYGELFSWRMMLTDKQGAVRLRVYDENNRSLGEVSLESYINERQLFKLVYLPKNFVPFCQFIESKIKEDKRNKSLGDIKIYVDAFKTINNRPFQRVINPNIELTSIDYSVFEKGGYILPFIDAEIKENYNEISDEEFLRFIK
jgi:hypothetical protein